MAVIKGKDAVRTAKPSEEKAIKKAQTAGADVQSDEEYDVANARRIWEFPELADVLPDICIRYREIVDEANKLEAERKELSSQIMPLMNAVEQRTILGDTWVAVKARGSKTGISETLLLEAGVSMETIEACRKTVKYDYIQVRRPTKHDLERLNP